jgi:2-methylisocitrate lyase-like PEP mutase family enzyme
MAFINEMHCTHRDGPPTLPRVASMQGGAVLGREEKGERFAALHERAQVFVVPNPWDVGTARLFAHLGFEALATTGAGFAFSSGLPDGATAPDALLDHAGSIAAATDLPVTADLEDGFGDEPEAVYETVLAAADRGLVGCSIEDRSYGRGPRRIGTEPYELALAVERVQAAAEATRALPFRFTLTARCENFLVGRPDLGDTIRRLQAFQEAGAGCLYAPGLPTRADVQAVVREVDRPVNVVLGLTGEVLSIGDLDALGVRRVSLGSTLARTALGAVTSDAVELRDRGTCSFAAGATSHAEACAIFAGSAPTR